MSDVRYSLFYKKWNLIWVGMNKVASLESHEIEMLKGFPPNHTNGGGISRTKQYTILGNAFPLIISKQIFFAYHLSVLKSMFLDKISVLSVKSRNFTWLYNPYVSSLTLDSCLF
ncbi:unnamed protein product [Coffea canephora]|uniref:DNA (cytosine-5-)-methyltransferase n=1 Tax=Coffea canephora TaxID=49390 RepID=A0A068UVP1_COFCA|nr:unnamed protein product [Coffea canephora]